MQMGNWKHWRIHNNVPTNVTKHSEICQDWGYGIRVWIKDKQTLCEYPCPFRGEDANRDTILKLRDGPHSIHFSRLFLVDVKKFHLPKKIIDFLEKENHPYTLEFDIRKEYIEALYSKDKEINFQSSTSGLLMFLPLPKDLNWRFNVKLCKRFKSSKWWDRGYITISSFL